MPHRKPEPLIPARIQNRCPVCGEISYSRGGVHPQCSVKLADAQRIQKEKSVVKPAKPASAAKAWQRVCPACKTLQHVRKKVCTCGHKFANRSRPPAAEDEV